MVHSEEYKKKRLERKQRFMQQSKKNNIFKARRRNNFSKSAPYRRFGHHQNNQGNFENQEKVEKKDSNALRQRGFFQVLPTDNFAEVPQCSHGPCLLFEKKNGPEVEETFFSCAIYRNQTEFCDFKKKFDKETGEIEKNEEEEKKKPKKKKIFGYNRIPKALSEMKPSDTILYCNQCINVFPNKHECVCEPIEKEALSFPTTLLPPVNEQHGESQFFFSQESLGVILKAIEISKVDGILCIGAPRIFENVRAQYPEKNVFLLDYDKRFAKFFPSKQYAQYSMLVDHFFDKNAESKLMEFFKNSKKVILITDPPFGVFMEPLLKSIEKMKSRFISTGDKKMSDFYSMIVLPIYIRKYVLHDNFWMSDYRVTYEGHKLYQYPEKTIVRLFTNLPMECIDLQNTPGYKFCEICDRFVTEKNVHCERCGSCTSVEQGKWNHCEECDKCVKPRYVHCVSCQRCHLYGRCIQKE